jgi:anti-sigma B factor antagonist
VAGAEAPLLRIATRRSGTTSVLRLDGELDCSTAPQLQEAIDAVLDAHPTDRVVVEAEGLRFADVAGLSPLIRAAREQRVRGAFRMRNARQPVVRVVRLLDLGDVLGLDG